MKYKFSPAKNPRVLIIQKVYGQVINNDQKVIFEKHRFKKFIKDVVLGTIERLEIINVEIKNIEKNFNLNNLDDILELLFNVLPLNFYINPTYQKKLLSKNI